MSCALSIHQKECRKSLGCALYIRCALPTEKYGTSFLLDPDNCHCFKVKRILYTCAFDMKDGFSIYRIYSRNSHTFLTKILYLNLGCVIYARKRFSVNKSGYTGNFLNIVLKG